ncbi:tandem C2 domains nuclear protein [Electrophorus electricus]|uniref:tandem C2 domains nuclear protein n=1 Tax=Electrophorus electricus TaxID=8005 RepID=UPI0015D08AC4|nr:tandem C2 domains nuclear protein [Electrophorus electricus]
MAMECIKNCCKIFITKEEEPRVQIIEARSPEKAAIKTEGKGRMGVSEDYLQSKLPPDGREIPFVLPSFRPSYVQPRGTRYNNFQSGLHGSARVTYAERKAELSGSGPIVCDTSGHVLPGNLTSHVSPGSVRRPAPRGLSSLHALACDQSGRQRLSASMLDLSGPHSPHMQHYDSVWSVPSSTSSLQDSFGSSRSLESITLSGDEKERELGKVCVRLSYQELVEQVWITLVQCKDIGVYTEGVEQQRVGVKGIITMAKPVQFKTSVKEATPDLVVMETFVFALGLEQLRSASLVLRVQTHAPRKRTLGECAVSLRTLGTQETEHWLELRPPCKAHGCHAELQLSMCFQPVSSRIQIGILAAQNLPSSSSLLAHGFFVKVEMFSDGHFMLKRKTKVVRSSGKRVQWAETVLLPTTSQDHHLQVSVKLYSCSSIRRKHLIGHVLLGVDSPSPDAMEQWKDSIKHPEKVVTAWHRVCHS